MSRWSDSDFTDPIDFPARPEDRHPDTLEWIRTIKAYRRTGRFPVKVRRCTGPCERTLPIADFPRDRAMRGGGRNYVCSDCDSARKRADRRRQKVAAFRAMLSERLEVGA